MHCKYLYTHYTSPAFTPQQYSDFTGGRQQVPSDPERSWLGNASGAQVLGRIMLNVWRLMRYEVGYVYSLVFSLLRLAFRKSLAVLLLCNGISLTLSHPHPHIYTHTHSFLPSWLGINIKVLLKASWCLGDLLVACLVTCWSRVLSPVGQYYLPSFHIAINLSSL